MIKAILALLVGVMSTSAMALPEFSRLGYFSCSSCHVNPNGGGVLTPYGRSMSAERLSMWAAEGEEKLMVPEVTPWLLFGSDWRGAAVDVETNRSSDLHLLRMQSDASAAVVLPHFSAEVQGGPLGQSEQAPQAAGKMQWRQYWASTSYDNFTVRAGRFLPRYGLNIPEHVVNIRRDLGFDEGSENLAGELSWLTESDDVALTALMGARAQEATGSRERGWTATWFHDLWGRARLGASLLSAATTAASRVAYGLSGVVNLPLSTFMLAEVDHQAVATSSGTVDQGFFYSRLGWEPTHGLVPFLATETSILDLSHYGVRTEFFGAGLQWYPRPHYDFEAEIGPTLNMQNFSFTTSAYLVAHYYL